MRRSRWLSLAMVLVLLASTVALVGAGPPAPPGNGPSDNGVPPGFTRVTHIFYGGRAAEKIVEHGPGNVPPPRRQERSECPEGSGTECTTNSWGGNKWFVLPVNWSLNLQQADTTPGEGDSLAAFEAGLLASSDTWENDLNSSFDATYLGTTGREASSFGRRARMDGNNDIDFGDLNRYSNAIAVVMYWYYTDSGEIVEADMRLNKVYSWTANVDSIADPDTETGNDCCFDVQNIATHEFGHFHAGLNDLYDGDESELTMYGYGALAELKKRTLGVGDELSIASAYPSEGPVDNPPSVSVTSPVDGAMVSGSVIVVADADDDNGVTQVEFFVNGNSLGVDGTAPYDVPWDTTATDAGGPLYPDGDYTISATATDTAGQTSSDSISVTLDNVNDPPVATFTYSCSGLNCDFDASGSYDPDGSITSYAWDFGDGSTGAGVMPSHTYAADGMYSVVLTVTDNDGATDIDSQEVTVSEAGATMHVGDLDGSGRLIGKSGKWAVSVTVTIHDENEGAVANATVTGEWSGAKTGTVSGATGSEGTVAFTTGPMKVFTEVTFTVDAVTHDTLTYDFTANHDPDGDSDGTTIIVTN